MLSVTICATISVGIGEFSGFSVLTRIVFMIALVQGMSLHSNMFTVTGETSSFSKPKKQIYFYTYIMDFDNTLP